MTPASVATGNSILFSEVSTFCTFWTSPFILFSALFSSCKGVGGFFGAEAALGFFLGSLFSCDDLSGPAAR